MSEPIFLLNQKIFDNVDMSDDLEGEIIDLAEAKGYAAHFIWTDAPIGFVSTAGSNDGINFVIIDTQATSGESGQHLLNVENSNYRYVKLSFTFDSGSGSLTAYLSAKRE